jgi:hypothetical protein
MGRGIYYYKTSPYSWDTSTSKDPPIYKLENDQCYYVDMPQSPIMIEQQLAHTDVVNLDKGS